MDKKLLQIEKTVALFGAALASHYLGSQSSGWEETAMNLGLSTSLVEGTFTVTSHILAHGVFENLLKSQEYFQDASHNELKTAIVESYVKTLSAIENNIVEQFKLKENLTKKIARHFFKQSNQNHEILIELKEKFFEPIFYALTNDEAICSLLEQNQQLDMEGVLKKAIENAAPDYYSEDGLMGDFIDRVCCDFGVYFKGFFLEEIKHEEKARTIYFSHLLETIIVNTENLKKDVSLINTISIQTDIKLTSIIKKLTECDQNTKEISGIIDAQRINLNEKLKSIENRLTEIVGPTLDKRDRRDYQNDFNKFDFKYGYLNFVGRNQELSELWNFIESKKDDRQFSWWMVTGPGGMGKSRIAQKICTMAEGYYAGFFDFKNETSLNPKWEIWIPELPTIIVIDYALSKIDKVSELIVTLSRRSPPPLARVCAAGLCG